MHLNQILNNVGIRNRQIVFGQIFEIPTIVLDVSLLTKCHKPPDFEVEKPLQGSVSAANNNGKILGTVKKEGYGKR